MASLPNDSADDESDGEPTRVQGVLYGHYRVGEVIGSGAMGTVHTASDIRSGELVALKVLHEHLAEKSELVSRFTREGRVLVKLRNPNIVRALDHGVTADGECWLAMERLQGGTLEALIRHEDHLPLVRALRFACDIARGLSAVHAHGIVHRDVKPANIFVVSPDSPSEVAKLIDFGIARVTFAEMGAHSVPYTRVDAMLGSAAFVAPEQAIGREVDARADVFSLAVTLYEMLTGKLPYAGDTIQAQLQARREGTMVPLEKRLGKDAVSPLLADLLDRALSRDPGRRPADGAAILRELEAVQAETLRGPARPGNSLRPRALAPAVSVPEVPFGGPADGFTLERRSRRGAVVVLATVMIAALLALGTLALLRALHFVDL